MTDQQRIEQLERDNSQLKQALRHYIRAAMRKSDQAGVEQIRRTAQEYLDEANMLENLIPLLKDDK